MSAFMDADREYFEDHLGTCSYTRQTFQSEHPFSCVGVKWITVCQIKPGVRVRFEAAA
jgi:hypothetical protein